MSEALIRSLVDQKTHAFVAALVCLVTLVATGHIDSATFGTSFSALVVAFMASVAYQEKASGS